jgi:hypothetical protein
MSIDLVVPTNISPSLQPIQDQNGDASALSVATNAVTIVGQDIVGSALPLVIQGNGVGQGQQTFGRIFASSTESTERLPAECSISPSTPVATFNST